jgi:C4-dicarboxylate-specific signal transduction histidine kinase
MRKSAILKLEELLYQKDVAEQKLKESSQKLIEASRKAGMSEVATGVLHNVGNVLNTMNISVEQLMDHLKNSKLYNLFELTDLLDKKKENVHDFIYSDEKGKMIPRYLISLGHHLKSDLELQFEEINRMNSNIEHVKEIVSLQQSLSVKHGLIERVSSGELIERAISINSLAYDRHGVELVREFDPDVILEVNSIKVLQILTNLISNAKYSLDHNTGSRTVIIKTKIPEDGFFMIEVIDNGMGISKEDMEHLFEYGFTTRQEGHGFGLHNSAIAAKEIGGELRVSSQGKRKGAVFSLIFPYKTMDMG